MMTHIRHIKQIFLLCVGFLLAGCAEEVMPGSGQNASEVEGDATLTLNVSVANSSGGTRTRDGEFSFDPTDNPYELINTLRVIIVRQDNTVEWNRLVTAPAGIALNRWEELEFKVSTTLGDIDMENDTRTESKTIYLIANEESISDNAPGINVVGKLKGLKSGRYEDPPQVDMSSEEFKKLTADEKWAIENKRKLYVPGDTFTPDDAAALIFYNNWPVGANGSSPDVAVPYINNQGDVKKYVPMTEFFEGIKVTSNLKTGANQNRQVENLFITRNLVKFRFSINADPGTSPFKVNSITFSKLMQKEYLFPNSTEYDPAKDQTAKDNEREIIRFNTPGFDDNYVCPYVFQPVDFGYATPDLKDVYSPALYFCETKTTVLTTDNKPIFTIGIDIEYPFTEEVMDESGNPVTRPVTAHYDGKLPLDNLPKFIPRNTVVDVKMTLTNGELSAVAIVLPYTAVSLNPEFGFNPPETDKLTVAPSLSLPMDQKALLSAKYTPTPTPPTEEDPTVFKLIWVSSDTSIILLEPENNKYDDPNDLRYVVPSESIELPYLNDDGSTREDGYSVPVGIVPVAPGQAEVAVYSQTGLVARCKVTVTETVTE